MLDQYESESVHQPVPKNKSEESQPTSPLIAAALDYVRRGWPVVMLHTATSTGNGNRCSCGKPDCRSVGKHPRTPNGLKDALTTEDQVQTLWGVQPDSNVGILTGKESGIIVIDVDPRNGGETTLAALEAEHGSMPRTIRARTGGGGEHILFKHPCVEIRCGAGVLGPGLDVKADGGYIVAVPSLHASGQRYEWQAGCAPSEIELAKAPDWLLAMISSGGKKKAAAKTTALVLHKHPGSNGKPFSQGERNVKLTSLAGRLRRDGLDADSIEAALQQTNIAKCTPPLDSAEVTAIAKSVGKYSPAPSPFNDSKNLTDLGNADRFAKQHAGIVRYCGKLRMAFVWDGTRFRPDENGEVIQLAKKTVRSLYAEAANEADDDKRKAIGKHARNSESRSRIEAIFAIARSEHEIAVRPEELDSDPWLFNVLNGTIDLRTGELRPHDPKDLITKIAPVEFDPGAQCPMWLEILDRIMGGNEALIGYLQRVFGYALTGSVQEQVLFIFFGSGANGKTVLIQVIISMMGDYARPAAPNLLLKTKQDQHPTAQADLMGARFIASMEIEKGRSFSESLVKQLTGGDKVKARFICKDFVSFDPTFKIVIACNHLPTVGSQDEGIWRRLRKVPFLVTIPPAEQDKNLTQKLKVELSGILAWAVRGCLEWQKNGLQEPPEVINATDEYRADEDVLAEFLLARCEKDALARTYMKDLYAEYKRWCEMTSAEPLNQKLFGMALDERGIRKDRTRDGIVRIGIKLKALSTPATGNGLSDILQGETPDDSPFGDKGEKK